MATFFLHIGMHKTGTTAVQTFFHRSRPLLREAGIEYPAFAKSNHTSALSGLFADPRKSGDPGPITGQIKAERQKLLTAFANLLKAMRGEGLDMLMSGEGVSLFRPVELAALRDFVSPPYENIVVLGLVRPPLAFARSAAQQRIKGGVTFSTFRRQPPIPQYHRRFAPPVTVFGRPNVRLAPYHRSTLIDGDALQSLFALMGVSDPALAEARAGIANKAVSLTAAKIISAIGDSVALGHAVPSLPAPIRERLDDPHIRALHGDYTTSVADHTGERALLMSLLLDIPGPRFSLPREILEDVAKSSVTDAAWLLKNFDIDVLALDEAIGDAPPMEAMHHFDAAEIDAVTAAFDTYIESDDPGAMLENATRRFNKRSHALAKRSLRGLRRRSR